MSGGDSWIGLSRSRLRWSLGSFFLALAIPTGILLRQTYQQLQWESFHQYRVLAEELAARIDSRLRLLIASEEARPRSDYAFLVLAGDPSANFIVRSPLSGYPVRSAIPGLIGYFQVDDQGRLTTPLLPPIRAKPAQYGIRTAELKARRELQSRIRNLLTRARSLTDLGRRAALPFSPVLHPEPPLPMIAGTSATESWSIEENREATLSRRAPWTDGGEGPWRSDTPHGAPLASRPASPETGAETAPVRRPVPADAGFRAQSRPSRGPAHPARPPFGPGSASGRDHAVFRGTQAQPPPTAPTTAVTPAIADRSSMDPFEFDRIDSGHFVLSRTVRHDGHRAVQGALIEPGRFLAVLVERDFRRTAVSRMSELEVDYRGATLLQVRGAQRDRGLADTARWRGDVLYRTRLSPPLSDIELAFTIDELPAGPGAAVVGWLGAILAVVLTGGCWLLYRLGLRQMAASEQQQNFVAAVSHELKTPLTSIRMYGEMLREGWVPDERRASCYDFICSESERLSRLITNVLQLARVSRKGLAIDLKPITAARLLENVQPRLAAQIEQAGFVLDVLCDESTAAAMLRVDEDCFAQIAINLVDNAVKFGAGGSAKRIELACYRQGQQGLVVSVRDFGPGVPKDRMKKIFRLFYRVENERVRETVGTGIGLALVQQLAAAMQAHVDMINREPGAEFRIRFDIHQADAAAEVPPH